MGGKQSPEYKREYGQRPEVKARELARRQHPEVRERKRLYDQQRSQLPGMEDRIRANREGRRKRPGVREADREKQREWHRAHPLNYTWRAMLARCERPEHHQYKNYGARGIRVCAEWHEFAVFESWVLENLGPRPVGHTLDRINNNGSYEPGNVRWATWPQQARNRRFPTAMSLPVLPYEGCER